MDTAQIFAIAMAVIVVGVVCFGALNPDVEKCVTICGDNGIKEATAFRCTCY